jgi:hypothetical protein
MCVQLHLWDTHLPILPRHTESRETRLAMRLFKRRNLLVLASLCIAVAYLPMTYSVLADDDDEDLAAVQDTDNSPQVHEHVVRAQVAKQCSQRSDFGFEFIISNQPQSICHPDYGALHYFSPASSYPLQFRQHPCAKRPPPIMANT